MAGHNMLEALSLEVKVHFHVPLVSSFVGPMIEEVEKVLVKPGWSALKKVSIKVSIKCCPESTTKVSEALQSLLDKSLGHLSKLESVAFNYSAYGKCELDIS